MKSDADKIIEEAMKLSEEERAKIAHALFESTEPSPDSEVKKAWYGEVKKRISQIDAGEIEMIPGEEFFKRFDN